MTKQLLSTEDIDHWPVTFTWTVSHVHLLLDRTTSPTVLHSEPFPKNCETYQFSLRLLPNFSDNKLTSISVLLYLEKSTQTKLSTVFQITIFDSKEALVTQKDKKHEYSVEDCIGFENLIDGKDLAKFTHSDQLKIVCKIRLFQIDNTSVKEECTSDAKLIDRVTYRFTVPNFSFYFNDQYSKYTENSPPMAIKSSTFSPSKFEHIKFYLVLHLQDTPGIFKDDISLYIFTESDEMGQLINMQFRFALLDWEGEPCKIGEGHGWLTAKVGLGSPKFIEKQILLDRSNGLLLQDQLNVQVEVEIFEQVKLIPFRHQWTIENFRWMCCEEMYKHWITTKIELEKGKWINLKIWPRGSGSIEYVGIEVGGWKMRLRGKVKVGEDGCTEREVEFAGKDGWYRMDEYLHRSTLLESASLLESNETLKVYLEGVAWDEGSQFNAKKNLDSISALMANYTEISSARFPFRPPMPQNYYAIKIDELLADIAEVNKKIQLVELDEQTTLAFRFVLKTDFGKRGGKKDSRYPKLDDSSDRCFVQLLKCPTNQLAIWARIIEFYDADKYQKLGTGRIRILNIREEEFLVDFNRPRRYSPRCLQMIRIEDERLHNNSKENIQNYENILENIHPAWFQQASHCQPPPTAISLPLIDSLTAKIVELHSLIREHIRRSSSTYYSIYLPPVPYPLSSQLSSEEVLRKVTTFMSETAHQLQNALNTAQSAIESKLAMSSSSTFTVSVIRVRSKAGQVWCTIKVFSGLGQETELHLHHMVQLGEATVDNTDQEVAIEKHLKMESLAKKSETVTPISTTTHSTNVED